MMTIAFIIDSVTFTPDVIAGKTSLGGSESACLGLARALAKRGHDVHIYATKMAPEAHETVDASGVSWFDYRMFAQVNQFIEFDVVCPLRVFTAFGQRPINARLRLLWNQDLLVPGAMQESVMSIAWALDQVCYVSAYHRAQWEQLQPELAGIGWVTRNGYDPTHLPASSTKDPNRIIHISRPERGLEPLLQMWPALKQQRPNATLQVCRYSSMYDTGPGSWSEVCASYDDHLKAVNAAVGGIEYLGELNKPALYQAISDAAVMWYPGVSTFAETSCIAAIEAQACGTPFVGSYRGALPETVPSGVLIRGEHDSRAYQEQSVSAVVELLDQCAQKTFDYRKRQKDGLRHVQSYTYDVIAAEWDAQIETWFRERYAARTARVLTQLLHEDDHSTARPIAEALGDTEAVALCDRVMAGLEHTADDYGQFALSDVLGEARQASRFKAAIPAFEQRQHVLDVACGNGSCAIALAWAYPAIHVHGVDFSTVNIERARAAAIEAGVADRVTFTPLTVYDFTTHELHAEMRAFLADHAGQFDGLFCGEFLEHVANYQGVIDGLEQALGPGSPVVFTCPHGACVEISDLNSRYRRSHVHRFHHDDIKAVFGAKRDRHMLYLSSGTTGRGQELGSWVVSYLSEPGRLAQPRPNRAYRTRPMPTLTVGMITLNAANDLGRALTSVRRIADEIIVGDTGSTDRTKEFAQELGARVLTLPTVGEWRDGFAGARNAVLKEARGDWFLWIDADEELVGGGWLRRYLDSPVFQGYVLQQTHLYLDGAPTYDVPIRLFRNTGKVQFYGCVHEQPQDGDPNADIHPILDVSETKIAHWGYLTAGGRENKRVHRNLPLLMRDQQVFADRLLGKVLCVREAVLQADAMRAVVGGQMTNQARDGYLYAIQMHTEHFDDPTHKYHQLSRPWYQTALRHLGIGWEAEIALAARFNGLEGRHAKPERLWVRDADEYTRIVAHKSQAQAKQMQPATFITDPDLLRPLDALREAVTA